MPLGKSFMSATNRRDAYRRREGIGAAAAGRDSRPARPSTRRRTSPLTGTAWVAVALMTMAMAALGLVGTSGINLRQVRESGLPGLVGYLMFGSFYMVTTAWTWPSDAGTCPGTGRG